MKSCAKEVCFTTAVARDCSRTVILEKQSNFWINGLGFHFISLKVRFHGCIKHRRTCSIDVLASMEERDANLYNRWNDRSSLFIN